jgi:hypothetical protein
MSTKITLRFRSHIDLDLLSVGIRFNLIRLLCDVDFQTPEDWSPKYQAIIDTGSPANIIPRHIWTQATHRIILPEKLSLMGIGAGNVSGYLGEVTARISYRKKSSEQQLVRAFLLNSDAVPLILGFEDFLSRGVLQSNYPKNLASLRF